MTMTIAAIVVADVSAHRLDEYLQAARLDINMGRAELELALTPGVAVAGSVIADIDRDHDGSLSPQEEQAYATRVLGAVDFELDGRRVPLQSIGFSFPDVGAMRRGEGTIRLHSGAVMTSQAAGAHQVLFRNTHRPDVSVYLANAVVPANDRLAITTQRRDRDQRELTVSYVVQIGPMRPVAIWLLVGGAATSLTFTWLAQRLRQAQPARPA
jgi:hypothetical protein